MSQGEGLGFMASCNDFHVEQGFGSTKPNVAVRSGVVALSRLGRCRDGWVYFIQAGYGGPVKIGKADSPRRRLANLQTANAEKLRLVAAIRNGAPYEQKIHDHLARARISTGEWFELGAVRKFLVECGVSLGHLAEVGIDPDPRIAPGPAPRTLTEAIASAPPWVLAA